MTAAVVVENIAADLEHLAVPIARVEPLPGNPRQGDVDAVARSYAQFGQRKPIVVRRTGGTKRTPRGVAIAGNHQLLAARQLGWSRIAVVWTDDDDLTAKAYALADNRTAELGGYDEDLLAAMIAEVATDADLLEATAWTEADLQRLVARAGDGTTDAEAADLDEMPPYAPRVVQRDDVWLLGDHRLLCGDCRDPDDVAEALSGRTINVAFTSPPYADRRDYDEDSGFVPVPPEEYVEWFAPVAENVAFHLADDGSWFVNIKAGSAGGLDTELYVLDLVIAHVRRWGWHFATELAWRRNGVPKHVKLRFKNQFEPVYQFTRGHWKIRPQHVAHASDGAIAPRGEGSGTNTWTQAHGAPGGVHDFNRFEERSGPGDAFPGNLLPTFSGTHEAIGHSAAFPVGLPQWFARAYSDEGDVVFDPFAGSGSTILAAQLAGRIGVGIEISPIYCDKICARFQRHTGVRPVLESLGTAVDFTNPRARRPRRRARTGT